MGFFEQSATANVLANHVHSAVVGQGGRLDGPTTEYTDPGVLPLNRLLRSEANREIVQKTKIVNPTGANTTWTFPTAYTSVPRIAVAPIRSPGNKPLTTDTATTGNETVTSLTVIVGVVGTLDIDILAVGPI